MRVSDKWTDYELIDCSGGERLERWGEVILIRPDPQIIWDTPKENPMWRKADAKYFRSRSGGGNWEFYKKIPDRWSINYQNLTFNIKTMGFKHTGLFPEQAVNWDFTADVIRRMKKNRDSVRVLNLFAYTGGATVSALKAGACVTHVDASKGMVLWAKENAASSGVDKCPVRWLVDDCIKFVEREIRRSNKYDIIIMDPPSYGRGPGGEVWKLEDEIYSLCARCAELLSDGAMFMLNSYSAGLSPAVMRYILEAVLKPKFGGEARSYELGLPVASSGLCLPCGSTAVWEGD